MPEEIILDPRNVLHFDSYDAQRIAEIGDDEIWKAIFAVQSELQPIEKTRDNTYTGSKYADLGDVWTALHPLLLKHSLLVTQSPGREVITKDVVILTIVRHIPTGQWVRFFLTMPGGATSQSVGSAITYGCRYALVNFFRAIAVGDDDDGNASTQGQQQRRQQNPSRRRGQQQRQNKAPEPRTTQPLLSYACDKEHQAEIEKAVAAGKDAQMSDADFKLCLPTGVANKFKLNNAQSELFCKNVYQAVNEIREARSAEREG